MIQKSDPGEKGCDLLPQIASDFFNSLEYHCNDLHMELDMVPVDKALIHIAVDVQQANVNIQDPFAELWLNTMLSKPREMCRTTLKLQPSEDYYDSPLADVSSYVTEMSVCTSLEEVLGFPLDPEMLLHDITKEGCESITTSLSGGVVNCQLLVPPDMTHASPKACFRITVASPGEKPNLMLPLFAALMLNGNDEGCAFNVRYLNVHKWNGRSF
ncbi:hypothetical protein CRM22_006205 [Opisthorchis felineus]|uniref:Uncharacterized protein n=1 Tax=Opisthorchis felineus TaxID=147828 RepID=A0A4S2LUE9_OPIFE|nr:hypothetical protein CRM22_006205 [Opisthorchis felineus]